MGPKKNPPKKPKLSAPEPLVEDMTADNEKQELESLERVSWRLVNTKDEQLGAVLAKLLPITIRKLDSTQALPVKQAIMKILAHANARLQGATSVSISPAATYAAYAEAKSPIGRSIGFVYVQKAFERCPPAELPTVVNMIVRGIHKKPREHQVPLLLHAFASLRGLSPAAVSAACASNPNVLANLDGDLDSDLDDGRVEDARLFLELATKLMMYVPARDGAQVSAMAGLSAADIEAMAKVPLLRHDTIEQVQLGVLEYVHAASMDPNALLLPYLAAASSPFAALSKRGETVLAKTCVVDTARPTVDVENTKTVKALFDTYLGNMEDEATPEGSRRTPASRGLQARIVQVLCKSTLACNMNPESSMLIHDAIFGETSGVSSQQQGMQFAVHVLRHAESLRYLAPSVVQHSMRILDTSQGNANMNALRGFAYQSLGQLAQRDPATLEEHKLELSKQCFEALKVEPPGVRSSVQETVNCLSNCFAGDATGAESVRDLLSQYVKSDNATVRQAALHWWVWVFPYSDCGARFHCILLSSDSNVNIADLAREGLDADKVGALQRAKGAFNAGSDAGAGVAAGAGAAAGDDRGGNTSLGTNGDGYPRLGDMLATIAGERPSLVGETRSARPVGVGAQLALPAASMEAMIDFLRRLATRESNESFGDSNDGATVLTRYFAVLSAAVVPQAPGSLHGVALDSMIELAARFDDAFLKHFSAYPQRFESMLQHIDETVSRKAARLLGFLGRAMDAGAFESLVERLHTVLSQSIEKAKSGKTVKQEDCLGATYAAGFLAAWAGLGDPAGPAGPQSHPSVTMLVDDLVAMSTASSSSDGDVVRSVALVALGYSSLGRPLDFAAAELRSLDPAALSADAQDKTGEPTVKAEKQGPFKSLKRSTHKVVPANLAEALGLLGMTEADEARKAAIVDEILECHTSKSEKLLEACGMALVFIWGDADFDDWRHLLGGATALADAATNAPRRTTTTTKTKTKTKTTNAKASSAAVRNKVLKFIVNKCISSTRSEARLAGATWLLSLIENVADTPEVSDNISDIQQAFCMLLGDSNDRTQELASRGVTTAYQHARDDSKSRLVDSLVGILSGGSGGGSGSNPSKWMRPNHVEGDTQIFEPGMLGSLPDQGGNISTYREICSLATDLGQPDLIYQFMNLAAHQAAADASRGAAYGMASVAAIAGDELKEHVQALIPRLYRSTFDPNPLVRDSMRHIWLVLVDDQREAIKKHLAAILSLLSKDMTRQQWRVRESAALAMADVLQGLAWSDIRDAFEGILKSCFRVIDDVKESVAVAGQSLARAISSLAVRLTDAQSTKSVDSKEFLGVMFPLLTSVGLGSDVPVIRAWCIDMLAKLTKSAGKEAVQESMQVIVPPLLEALSGMEDARLNYLEQHVQRLGVDGDRFEEARIRYAQSSPIADTLDLCSKHVTGQTFCDLSGMLISFIRKAVGTATKSGTATFIVASVRRLGSEVKPVSFSMMKALHEASALERSASVRRGYASAYANLSKYAPRSKMDTTVDTWLSQCKQEDADQDAVLLTGIMLKAISSEASDVFLRYADDLAPLAFLLKYEVTSGDDAGSATHAVTDGTDKKPEPKPTPAATMWEAVWEEVTTATGSGVRGHVAPVTAVLLEALSSSHWGRKKAAGRGIVVLGETAGDILGDHLDAIVDGLLRSLSGRLWDGKEVLLESLSAVVINGKAGTNGKAGIVDRAVEALLTACQKKTVAYNTVAFAQLGRVAKSIGGERDGEEAGSISAAMYAKAWPVFEATLQIPADHEVTDGTNGTNGTFSDAKKGNGVVATKTPLAVIIDSLAAFWTSPGAASRDAALASSAIDTLVPVLRKRCEKVEDQKSTLQALWEVVDKAGIGGATVVRDAETTGRVVSLADALATVAVSGKAEHNRLLAADIILKLVGSGAGELKDGTVSETLRAHHDKSAAVRARIDEILKLI